MTHMLIALVSSIGRMWQSSLRYQSIANDLFSILINVIFLFNQHTLCYLCIVIHALWDVGCRVWVVGCRV